MKLDVIIVNWNAGRQLVDCVESLLRFGCDVVNKIIVVDNGSIDGSLGLLAANEKLLTISAGENLGFGKACNLGVRYSDSEFLLFLNPDAAVFSDTLSKVADFFSTPESARVGILGVKLIDSSGHVARSCARFPDAISFALGSFGLSRLVPGIGYMMQEWDHQNTRLVDHVIGALYLVRREVYNQLEGFDERFFVYLEDLDFSYRARLSGWDSIYFADATAFHFGGGVSGQVKGKRLFYSLRSRLIYANKHFGMPAFILVLLTTLFVEPLVRITYSVLNRSWKSISETFEGYLLLFKWLPKFIFDGIAR